MESVLQRNAKLEAPPLAVANDDGVLPTDMLRDVLLRLPADVLCRLRLVCRSWRSLTSDPTFAKAHSSRHPLVVVRDCDKVQFLDPFSGTIVKRIRTRSDFVDQELSGDIDLLCMSGRYGPEKALALNPATGAITTLPTVDIVAGYESKSNHSWSVRALGRVVSTGEYKVLHVCKYFDPQLSEQTYQVTTLGGDAAAAVGDVGWRVVLEPCPHVRVTMVYTRRAVVNGVVYFLLEQYPESDCVAAFDLATEQWRRPMIQGPLSSHNIRPKNKERIFFHLANLDGCLVSICHYIWGYLNEDCSMDLWFLMDVEKELWTKRYSLRTAPVGHLDVPGGYLSGCLLRER